MYRNAARAQRRAPVAATGTDSSHASGASTTTDPTRSLVTPSPGALALAALGGVALKRRKR